MSCTEPQCPIPISPTNGEVVLTGTQATLVWNDLPEALDYLVYVWEDGDDEPEEDDYIAIVYSPTYTVTGLFTDTPYRWKILARKYCPTDFSILLRSSDLRGVIDNFGVTLQADLEFYLDTEGDMPLSIDLNMNRTEIVNLAEGVEDTDLITVAQWEAML